MIGNVNNNQLPVATSDRTRRLDMFSEFKDFADSHQNDEAMRVQFGTRGSLGRAEYEAGALARAFKTSGSALARAANNVVRTALLESVLAKCNVSRFDDLPEFIRNSFSGSKEFTKGADMALNDQGEATSGRPLSVRRIAAVVNATTAYLEANGPVNEANGPVNEANGPANGANGQENQIQNQIDLVFANSIEKLNSVDPTNPLLPTFDLDTSRAIKLEFADLIDKIVRFGFNTAQKRGSVPDFQFNGDQIRRHLRLFFNKLSGYLAQISPKLDLNTRRGILTRFKDVATAALKELNRSREFSLGSNEGEGNANVDAIMGELDDIGSGWKKPDDNVTLFNKLFPNHDAEFLKTVNVNLIKGVNDLLTAFEKIPSDIKDGEKLRNRLLARLSTALTQLPIESKLPLNRLGTVKKWLTAFGFDEKRRINEDEPDVLVRTLLRAEQDKVREENVA